MVTWTSCLVYTHLTIQVIFHAICILMWHLCRLFLKVPKKDEGENFNELPKYSLEKLQSADLPDDIDHSKKEVI